MKKARKGIRGSGEKARSGTAGYGATGPSTFPIRVASVICKRALENSLWRGARDGPFLDAAHTWYRLLKDFSVHEEDERRFHLCELERDATRASGSVAGVHVKAAAGQLWYLPEAMLCSKAQLYALQNRFFRLKWNE